MNKNIDFERMKNQYLGTNEIRSESGQSAKSARVVRNITYELIESEIEGRVPIPCCRPKKKSVLSEINALTVTEMLKNLRDELPFELLNDEDERNTYIYGTSAFFVEWEEEKNNIKLSLLSPTQIVPEPQKTQIEEMNYFFLTFVEKKVDIENKYGVTLKCGEPFDDVEVVVCFFKKDGRVSQYIFSDEREISFSEDYYARRAYPNESEKGERTSDDGEKVYEFTLDENVDTGLQIIPKTSPIFIDGILQEETVFDEEMYSFENLPKMRETKIQYYSPTMYPVVIRKNISDSMKFFGQSDADAIFSQQQEINKLETRIMEKLLKAGVMPYSSETTDLRLSDEIFTRGIKLKNVQEKNLLGVLDLQVAISQDAMQSDRLYQQAKRILGISDSFQGMPDSTATSGRAKQALINQSGGRLESKRIMKNFAYAELDKLVFQFFLAFSKRNIPVYFRTEMGKEVSEFNPYNFLVMKEDGSWAFDDNYLFSADITSDIERDKAVMWSEIRTNFREGVFGDQSAIETKLLFWENMMNARYPYARENIEKLLKQEEKMATKIADSGALMAQIGGGNGYS